MERKRLPRLPVIQPALRFEVQSCLEWETDLKPLIAPRLLDDLVDSRQVAAADGAADARKRRLDQ